MLKKIYGLALMLMMLFVSTTAMAQSVTVTGTVTDQTGEVVIGASILEKGTSTGTITDFDGNFAITVDANATLVISYVGYQTQEVALKGKKVVNVVMSEDAQLLDEVVAVGYGSQKKKEVTGSVSSVKAEDFNAGVKSSPVGLLQGKVAGLNISRQGGDPTSTGYNIQIRGFSTLGKGTGSSPLYIVDGIPVNNIDNIAPEEIASMDVLKDGSAAAIYGTRGTNGVIIITTKRGDKSGETECGTTNVEYSGYVSYSAPKGSTGMLTAEQYRNLETLSGGKIKPVIYTGPNGETYSTNWMKELMNPAPITHNHNLAITGATKNFSYRGALSFKDAQGVAKNSGRDEVIAKFAANQNALNGWVTLQYDASYMWYKNTYFCGDFKQGATLNPTYPVRNSDDEDDYFLPSGSGQSNPVASMNQKESFQTGNYFRGSVRATVNIKPVAGLKVNAFAAYELGNNNSYWYNSQKFLTNLDEAGRAGRSTSRNLNQLYELTVDYAGQWGAHSLTAVAGLSYQKFFNDGMDMANQGFATDGYKWYSMGDGDPSKEKLTIGSYTNSNVLAGAFLRANYNFDDRYLISASVRREGSSRFGANNKWGWFPATSIGWRIKKESFMTDVDWVSDLKLRFGFGITGNNLGSDLASVELLSNGGKFWYNGEWVNTYKVAANANPDLRWEKKYEYNLGIDYAFLENRLFGSLDLYMRNTVDLLWEYDVPTPPYQYNKLLANCGAIQSKGIELAITGIPVKTKNWEWSSTFTIAFNDNKITKLSDKELGLNYSEMLTGGVGENGIQGVNTQKIVEGESVGIFYGYKVDYMTPDGKLVYEKDEDGKAKMQIIGRAQPIFTYGWNNTIRYKNWDLTIFFRGNYGNDILNVKRWAYGPNKSQGLNTFMKDVEAIANGTGVYRQGKFSDYYLEDGSFLKLDNITLGYTFKFKPNKYAQSLRLYATGENLFTITSYSGIDPDVNTSDVWNPGIDASGFYPSIMNVMLGVSVTLF